MARYEPATWGYSDGDVINTSTKKFLDGTASAFHESAAVNGSPTYKTNITPTGAAVVRFDGSSRVRGDWSIGRSDQSNSHTVAVVIIPRTLNKNIIQYVTSWGITGAFTFSGVVGVYDPTGGPALSYAEEASAVTSKAVTGTTSLVVGTAYVLTTIYDSSGSGTVYTRVNRVQEGSLSMAGVTPGSSASSHFVGGESHAAGENAWWGDVAAVFLYNVALAGSNLTDLESYLYTTYVHAPVAYTDTLLPASYALTGQALKQGYGQTLAPASYALTGQSVTEVTGGGLLGGHGGAQWTPQPGGRR